MMEFLAGKAFEIQNIGAKGGAVSRHVSCASDVLHGDHGEKEDDEEKEEVVGSKGGGVLRRRWSCVDLNYSYTLLFGRTP